VLREEQDIVIRTDVGKAADAMKSFGGKTKLAWIMDEYRYQVTLCIDRMNRKVPRHLTDVCVKGFGDLNCPG
jgi:hypothetical protein